MFFKSGITCTTFLEDDTNNLSSLVLITAIFAAFTAGTGFYYNKAKAENLKKLAKELKKEEIDTEDIQTAKILLDNSPIENNNSELY